MPLTTAYLEHGGLSLAGPGLNARTAIVGLAPRGRPAAKGGDDLQAPPALRYPEPAATGREHRRGRPGDGQLRSVGPAPGQAARRLAAGPRLGQRLGRQLAAGRGQGVRDPGRGHRRPEAGVRHHARPRETRLPIYTPREAAGHLAADVAQGFAVGLLFGGERAGLETDDIALCQAIVPIPIDERFRSLNLAQAVSINAYEWKMTVDDRPWSRFEYNVAEPADQSSLWWGCTASWRMNWRRPASTIRRRRSRRWSATCAPCWAGPG